MRITDKKTGETFTSINDLKLKRGKENNKWNLKNLKFYGVFRGSDFRDSVFRGSVFRDSDFRDSDFRDSDFRDSVFRDSDFKDSVFRDSDFRDSVFRDSVFRDSVFRGSVFRGSDFRGSVFRDSDFRDSVFRDSDFRDSVFRDSVFRGSDFRDSDFSEKLIKFKGGILELIEFYKKEGNSTTSIEDCPLCTIANKEKVKCIGCPWVQIEGSTCTYVNYSKHGSDERVLRLERWLRDERFKNENNTSKEKER
jgi:hypothetical protein